MNIDPSILAELSSLKPVRVQKVFELFHKVLVIEVFSHEQGRLFLIFDQNQSTRSLHMQKEPLPGLKTISPLMLALRKYLVGKIIRFSSTDSLLQATIDQPEENLKLIFELELSFGAILLNNSQVVAQTKHAKIPKVFLTKTDASLSQPSLDNNFEQAKKYHLLFTNYYQKKAINLKLAELKNKLKKKQILFKNIQNDLIKCEKMQQRKQEAELLKANLSILKKGLSSIEVVDYFSDNQPNISIKIDPLKTPEQNITLLFNQIKRAKRGIEIIKPRLEKINKDIEELKNQISDLLSKDLSNIDIKKILNEEKNLQQKIKQQPARLPYKRFVSSDGYQILVAKSAKDGDELSFKIAQGNDWWLHAEDVAGAHVVIKCPSDNLKTSTLIEAAMLAAYFSKAKDEARVSVIYTRVKFVKKSKGAALGSVLISKKNSLLVHMGAHIINRLTASLDK